MKTEIQSDHIWDMLKRRAASQLVLRRFRRTVRRQVAKHHERRNHD